MPALFPPPWSPVAVSPLAEPLGFATAWASSSVGSSAIGGGDGGGGPFGWLGVDANGVCSCCCGGECDDNCGDGGGDGGSEGGEGAEGAGGAGNAEDATAAAATSRLFCAVSIGVRVRG